MVRVRVDLQDLRLNVRNPLVQKVIVALLEQDQRLRGKLTRSWPLLLRLRLGLTFNFVQLNALDLSWSCWRHWLVLQRKVSNRIVLIFLRVAHFESSKFAETILRFWRFFFGILLASSRDLEFPKNAVAALIGLVLGLLLCLNLLSLIELALDLLVDDASDSLVDCFVHGVNILNFSHKSFVLHGFVNEL